MLERQITKAQTLLASEKLAANFLGTVLISKSLQTIDEKLILEIDEVNDTTRFKFEVSVKVTDFQLHFVTI